jgi:DNA-directed RNA polymerase subunit RPC12/RpoP
MECQYCSRRILTDIEHETTWIGIMGSFVLFFIFKIFSLPLIMLLIPLTQKTVHKCTNCRNTVGQHTFYDMLALTDKLFTFKIGNFALIFTRKQLIGVFLFILFSIITYIFISSVDFTRGSIF